MQNEISNLSQGTNLKNLSSNIKTDNKIFWSYVRSKSKPKSVVSKLEMPDGNLTSSVQETANTLNNYFATVFEIEPNEPLPDFVDLDFAEPLEYININITDKNVEKVLVPQKPGKSQGPDFFSPKIYQRN